MCFHYFPLLKAPLPPISTFIEERIVVNSSATFASKGGVFASIRNCLPKAVSQHFCVKQSLIYELLLQVKDARQLWMFVCQNLARMEDFASAQLGPISAGVPLDFEVYLEYLQL